MKIAHFTIFAPHASGQYETVKDLILSERSVGIDARFIDYGFKDKRETRDGLQDGEIVTHPVDWALDHADLIFCHSLIPNGISKPVILALHGRPENSFRLEFHKISPIISFVIAEAKKKKYQAYVTFWKEYLFYWSRILPGEKIFYIPSPIDLKTFSPQGTKYDFGENNGTPNIVIADMWREDTSPFNLIFAAKYFKEHFYGRAKLHIYGIPQNNSCINFLSPLKKSGLIGELRGIVGNLPDIYRAADMVITPNIIATRIVRESLASGTPIVAPVGCRFTDFQAEPRDYISFANAIKRCFKSPRNPGALRKRMIDEFNPEIVGNTVKHLSERIVGSFQPELPQWNAMSITQDDWEFIKEMIKIQNVKSIVEFGSGVSTQLFDSIGIKVDSFETMPEMIEKTKKMTPSAVLNLWDGKSIPQISGDMAFIDGPWHGENREPSYRVVAESSVPIVICHDIKRPEDRQWVEKYFKDWKTISGTNNLLALKRVKGDRDELRI